MKTRFASIIVSLLVTSTLMAQAGPVERILFPILSKPFAGSLGSLWHSELFMLIDTEDDISITPLVDCVFCEESLPRRQSFTPPFFFQQPGHPPGSIIYVPAETERVLHFSLSVRDVSRQDSGERTEIPVVREHDFQTGRIHLPSVPIESGFRQTLRIYDVGARPGAAIRLRVIADSEIEPAFDRLLSFSFSPAHNPNHVRPATPGYLQVELSTIPELSGLEQARIELEPVTDDLEYWAFVTLTNNVTQQVTVISPQ